jgi:hypothetical protein
MIDLGWTLMALALVVVLIALIFEAHEAQGRMSRGGMGSRQSAGAVGRVSPGVNNLQGFQGRVVSYGFDMGDWAPKIMETYRRSSRGFTSSLPLVNFGANASSDHCSPIA